jgi:hypothetical protein
VVKPFDQSEARPKADEKIFAPPFFSPLRIASFDFRSGMEFMETTLKAWGMGDLVPIFNGKTYSTSR